MKFVLIVLTVSMVVAPTLAFAGNSLASVPEMDGAVLLQFAALAGGLALLLKRKNRK